MFTKLNILKFCFFNFETTSKTQNTNIETLAIEKKNEYMRKKDLCKLFFNLHAVKLV